MNRGSTAPGCVGTREFLCMVFSTILWEEAPISLLWDSRNAGISSRPRVCFLLEGLGDCTADHVSSWHGLLDALGPNLWPTLANGSKFMVCLFCISPILGSILWLYSCSYSFFLSHLFLIYGILLHFMWLFKLPESLWWDRGVYTNKQTNEYSVL